MRNPFLVCLAALALAPLAKADKFWLEHPDQASTVEGSLPATIDGVLLEETDTQYRVRTVGGEIWLDKAGVFRVDKDGLTVEQVERTELQQADALAAATAERIEAQQIARVEQRQMEAVAAEAALRTPGEPVVIPPADEVPPLYFDPVIDALGPVRYVPDYVLLRELELAYELTGDDEIIKALRKLRRLR